MNDSAKREPETLTLKGFEMTAEQRKRGEQLRQGYIAELEQMKEERAELSAQIKKHVAFIETMTKLLGGN